MELGSRFGWVLSAHTYCDEATFVTRAEPRETIELTAHQRDVILSTILDEPVIRGRKGGTQTAKRGPEYYRDIAAMRITHGGGRPKKT